MVFVDPTGLTPQQYLKKFQDAFELENKYKILGKNDAFFQSIASGLTEARYDAIKAARTAEAIVVKQKGTSTDPLDKKAVALAHLRFERTVADELNLAKGTGATAVKTASAIKTATFEFSQAVTKYITAAGDSPDITKDTAFENTARQLYNKLLSQITQLKPRLINEHQFYNANVVKAQKDLADIKAALDAFVPGTPAPLAAAPADDGSGVDIIV